MRAEDDNIKKSAYRMMLKHPGRVPIIVEDADNVMGDGKKQFLVPGTFKANEFLGLLRQRTHIDHRHGLFLVTKSRHMLPNSLKNLSDMHNEDCGEDLILRFVLKKENVFGGFQATNSITKKMTRHCE